MSEVDVGEVDVGEVDVGEVDVGGVDVGGVDVVAVEEEPVEPVIEGDGLAVRTVGLTKRFGDLIAVRDLSLDVPTGSVFGLIGPNGAGKSTTLSILASVLTPTSGTARVAGCDPVHDARGVRRRVGYMPDVLGVYDNLSVQEYLEFFAAAYALPRAAWKGLVDGLLELVGLEVKRTAMVESLSRGMKQRLALARALVHDPEVLLLDEPASGLDPRARVELRALLAELQSMGKTIVISSHILSEMEEMCSHVAIMEAGRLLAVGSPRDIGAQVAAVAGRRVTVHLAGGEVRHFTVADEDEQQALLRRLVVDEDLAVVEFRVEGSGLEDVFLHVTEGTLQ
ncbi:MAG: type transport system ATP-binding protein [Actinomycetota bacterium]|nr:type transport system ATP-binding protein [Actinomycetota bacterium]